MVIFIISPAKKEEKILVFYPVTFELSAIGMGYDQIFITQ